MPPKSAIVAVMRNESVIIREWIAYHAACGFDGIILFDNDSTDDTVAQARSLQATIDIRLHRWPDHSRDYQNRAYLHAARRYELEFGWLAFFDTDEFLVLDHAEPVPAFLARQRAAAIAIPWAIFGSSGHRTRPQGLVIDNFLQRSRPDFFPNRHLKTIARPERVIDFKDIHYPNMDGPYSDAAGRAVITERPGLLAADPDYAGGKLHHYFTRSWEDWQAKLARGYRDTTRDESAFSQYDLNDIFDAGARAFSAAVKISLARSDGGQ